MVCIPGEDTPYPVLAVCPCPSFSSAPMQTSIQNPSQTITDNSSHKGDEEEDYDEGCDKSTDGWNHNCQSPSRAMEGYPGPANDHFPNDHGGNSVIQSAASTYSTACGSEDVGGVTGVLADHAGQQQSSDEVGLLLRWEMPPDGSTGSLSFRTPISRWMTPQQIERAGGKVVSAATNIGRDYTADLMYHWTIGELDEEDFLTSGVFLIKWACFAL